jgi:hypothetical protein
VGSSSAKNFAVWSYYVETPATMEDGRVVWKCPDPAPKVKLAAQPSSVVEKSEVRTEIAINIPKVAVDRAVGPDPDDVIYLIGRVQYNDIFPDTPLHYLDWCVAAVPANPILGQFSFHRMYERED